MKPNQPTLYGNVKAGAFRLSPNEVQRLFVEERNRRRKLRIVQVREQMKVNAARTREAVKAEKERQIKLLEERVKREWEKEKEEKLRELQAIYDKSVKAVGQAHREADAFDDKAEEEYKKLVEDTKAADERYKLALDKARMNKVRKEMEMNKHIIARKSALETEKQRAAHIASLPPPPKDTAWDLQDTVTEPVKMTDVDAFSTTHYHLAEDYVVEKAEPEDQGDAKQAAAFESERLQSQQKEDLRDNAEQVEKARLRHIHALQRERLKEDYNQLLLDLSDLQRDDIYRRQQLVANIPKKIFLPPSRRLEEREDKQQSMGQAFEDLYMAGTGYIGDLSLALDPHPPPETPSASDSLELSVLSDEEEARDEFTIHPPAGPTPGPDTSHRVPLQNVTNVQLGEKKRIEEKPKGPVIKKLMDKIRRQRDEWLHREHLPDPGSPVEKRTPDKKEVVPSSSSTTEATLSEHTITTSSTQSSGKEKSDEVAKTQEGSLPSRALQEPVVSGATLLHPMEEAAKIRVAAEKQKQQIEQLARFQTPAEPGEFYPLRPSSSPEEMDSENNERESNGYHGDDENENQYREKGDFTQQRVSPAFEGKTSEIKEKQYSTESAAWHESQTQAAQFQTKMSQQQQIILEREQAIKELMERQQRIARELMEKEKELKSLTLKEKTKQKQSSQLMKEESETHPRLYAGTVDNKQLPRLYGSPQSVETPVSQPRLYTPPSTGAQNTVTQPRVYHTPTQGLPQPVPQLYQSAGIKIQEKPKSILKQSSTLSDPLHLPSTHIQTKLDTLYKDGYRQSTEYQSQTYKQPVSEPQYTYQQQTQIQISDDQSQAVSPQAPQSRFSQQPMKFMKEFQSNLAGVQQQQQEAPEFTASYDRYSVHRDVPENMRSAVPGVMSTFDRGVLFDQRTSELIRSTGYVDSTTHSHTTMESETTSGTGVPHHVDFQKPGFESRSRSFESGSMSQPTYPSLQDLKKQLEDIRKQKQKLEERYQKSEELRRLRAFENVRKLREDLEEGNRSEQFGQRKDEILYRPPIEPFRFTQTPTQSVSELPSDKASQLPSRGDPSQSTLSETSFALLEDETPPFDTEEELSFAGPILQSRKEEVSMDGPQAGLYSYMPPEQRQALLQNQQQDRAWQSQALGYSQDDKLTNEFKQYDWKTEQYQTSISQPAFPYDELKTQMGQPQTGLHQPQMQPVQPQFQQNQVQMQSSHPQMQIFQQQMQSSQSQPQVQQTQPPMYFSQPQMQFDRTTASNDSIEFEQPDDLDPHRASARRFRPPRGPPPVRRTHILSDEVELHELSTIQEMETPRSLKSSPGQSLLSGPINSSFTSDSGEYHPRGTGIIIKSPDKSHTAATNDVFVVSPQSQKSRDGHLGMPSQLQFSPLQSDHSQSFLSSRYSPLKPDSSPASTSAHRLMTDTSVDNGDMSLISGPLTSEDYSLHTPGIRHQDTSLSTGRLSDISTQSTQWHSLQEVKQDASHVTRQGISHGDWSQGISGDEQTHGGDTHGSSLAQNEVLQSLNAGNISGRPGRNWAQYLQEDSTAGFAPLQSDDTVTDTSQFNELQSSTDSSGLN